MTTIEKLGISGIRSYGPDRETVLKFQRPLTIIWGQNGSGKSTIIEAVKMATTGDLPPVVSQGAAFINDPRIRNAPETNAKIRLQFTNVRGEDYLVSRHFCLRVMSTGRSEFKTVDQTLKRGRGARHRRPGQYDDIAGAANDDDMDERQQHSTSHRCAELNALLPDLMRITKPILNSVIFVHQEDSLWPLGDPKRLKERFDDIFAATRYTKALESIRRFRREQSSELRFVNSELMRHEQSAKICEKLREQADKIRITESKLRAGVDAVQGQMVELQSQLKRARRIHGEHSRVERELSKLDAAIEQLEVSRSEQYEVLTENLVDLRDDELEKLIDDLEDGMRRADGERRDRSSSLEHARKELEELARSLGQSQKTRGVLEAEAAQQRSRLSELTALKRRYIAQLYPSSKRLDVVEVAPEVGASLSDWTSALETLCSQARNRACSMKEARSALEDHAAEAVSHVQARLSTQLAISRQARQEASEKRRLAAAKRAQLGAFAESVSLDLIASTKADVSRCADAYESFLKRDEESRADIEFRAAKENSERLQRDVEPIRRERDMLSTQQRAQVAIQHRKEDLLTKKRSLSLASEDLLGKIVDCCTEAAVPCDVAKFTASSEGKDESLVREESLKTVDRLVSRRARLEEDCSRDCNLSLQRQSLAVAEESRLTDVSLSDARALEASEQALVNLRSNLPSSLRDIVGDGDLIASTVTVSDASGKITIFPCNMEALATLESKLEEAQKRATISLARSKSSAAYLKRALEYFEEKGSCMTCGHTGDGRDRIAQLTYMNDVLRDNEDGAGVSRTVMKWESRLAAVEAGMKWVQELARQGEEICRLRGVASLSQSRARQASSSRSVADAEKNSADLRTEKFDQTFGAGSYFQEALRSRDVVQRLVGECLKAERDHEVALRALPSASTARSMQDVERDIREFELNIRRSLQKVEDRRSELQILKDEKVRLEQACSRSRERLLQVENQFEKQRQLEREKDELMTTSRQLDVKANTVSDELVSIQAELKKCQDAHSSVREESTRVTDAHSRLVSECENAIHSWTVICQSVEAYQSASKAADLSKLERHIKVTQESIDRLQADVKQHTKDLESAGDALREKSAEIRNATDNKKLRVLKKQLEMTQGQAREARRDLERFVSESTRIASELVSKSDVHRNAAESGVDLDSDHERADAFRASTGHSRRDWNGKRSIARMCPEDLVNELTLQYNSRDAVYNSTLGKAQVYTERWMAKQEEIQEADRLGSMRQYEKCRITKQTMELASSDLDRYHRALDQALMSFHALKMDNINKSIRELWQATYRGNDIDEIEIVSDPGDGTSGAGRRNYNYRVVMRRGDAKLDMRGRCSAGQKVLACLVIRLALAESFCSECGILALDEPTTNLDRDNVESLASALRAIIESRRGQSHFQLILISHDQEFLSMMSARSYCDHYLLVYKNDAGYSVS